MIGVLAAIAVSWATGAMVVSAVWPRDRALRFDLSLILPLGLGLGMGISSLVYYGSMLLRGPMGWHAAVYDVLLLVGLGVIFGRRVLGRWKATDAQPPVLPAIDDASPTPAHMRRLTIALGVVLAGVAVLHLMTLTTQWSRLPHGAWDAAVFWNYRGRFIALAGENWNSALKYAHAPLREYPLALPCTNARMWNYAGDVNTWSPRLVGGLAAATTIALLFATVRRLRGMNQALVAVITLLAFPFFVMHTTSQYAEPLLILFMLCAAIAGTLATQSDDGHRLFLLVGLAAGCAAWTKNEGLLFCAVVGTALIGSSLVFEGPKAAGRRLLWMAMACVPVLLVVWHMKANALDTTSQMFNVKSEQGQTLSLVERVLRFERHREVLAGVWVQVVSYPQYAVMFLLPMYAVVVGAVRQRGRTMVAQVVAIALVVATLLFCVLSYRAACDLHPARPLDIAVILRWTLCWVILVGAYAVYGGFCMARFVRRERDLRPITGALAGLLVVQLCAYYAVFMVARFGTFSAIPVRLFDDIWPIVVLVFFGLMRSPDAMLAAVFASPAQADDGDATDGTQGAAGAEPPTTAEA